MVSEKILLVAITKLIRFVGMREKKVTATEYAQLRGITPQAATKAIRQNIEKGGPMPPAVIQIERYGKRYLLTIDENKVFKR